MTLRSQTVTEELPERPFLLKGDEEYMNVYIKKNLHEKERINMKELKEEAKISHDERKEVEKNMGGE